MLEADLRAFMRTLDIPYEHVAEPTKRARILLVDDELPARRLMRRIIEKSFPRVEIEEASDGYEAGFKTRDFKPDLVILDLLLPCIDGIKVCRIIRKSPELKGAKIMAVTGYRVEKSKKVIMRAGADEFLSKPFSPEEFANKVRQFLQ